MLELVTRNWPAKLAVAIALVLVLRGFLKRIADPIAAATKSGVDPFAILAVEIVLLAAYTLGLFAFPGEFWRRAFKFICLMTAYMLLGPAIADLLAGAGVKGRVVSVLVGHLLALALGFMVYKVAWPILAPYAPGYNPAA